MNREVKKSAQFTGKLQVYKCTVHREVTSSQFTGKLKVDNRQMTSLKKDRDNVQDNVTQKRTMIMSVGVLPKQDI